MVGSKGAAVMKRKAWKSERFAAIVGRPTTAIRCAVEVTGGRCRDWQRERACAFSATKPDCGDVLGEAVGDGPQKRSCSCFVPIPGWCLVEVVERGRSSLAACSTRTQEQTMRDVRVARWKGYGMIKKRHGLQWRPASLSVAVAAGPELHGLTQ